VTCVISGLLGTCLCLKWGRGGGSEFFLFFWEGEAGDFFV